MSQNKTVVLHGGPLHGEVHSLPHDARYLRIVAPFNDRLGKVRTRLQPYTEEELNAPIKLQYGCYDEVSYSPGDFEWSGWEVSQQKHGL